MLEPGVEISAFAVVMIAILIYSLVSGKLSESVITPPMAFAALGLAAGPDGLGIVSIRVDSEVIRVLAELTLALVLFTDAARINLRDMRAEHDLPVRLLGVAMPLTILLGIGAALLYPDFGLWEAALLAAILAPTDPALAQLVVSNPRVPGRIRQTLNIESGLNDGIALPIVILFASLASGSSRIGEARELLSFLSLQLVMAPILGALVGYAGAKAIDWAADRALMTQPFQDMVALLLALIAFAVTEVLGGSGFIAAFVAGLALGNSARHLCRYVYEFAEAEGQLLSLITFFVLGAVLAPQALPHLAPADLVYAMASLTVIRMLPVWLSLRGTGLTGETVAFVGWFGPRGLASVLFALLVVHEADIAHSERIFAIAILTVLLSVLLHGLSNAPYARWYARRLEALEDGDRAELREVGQMPTRVSHGRRRNRHVA